MSGGSGQTGVDPNPFQRRATEVGAAFETLSAPALTGAGFDILDWHYYIGQIGIQVDFRCRNKKGVEFLIECKGSLHGTRPGLERTDTTKKALCNAFLVRHAGLGPFLLLTSHLPQPDSDSFRMLQAAGRETVLDVIAVHDKAQMKRLEWLARADRADLRKFIQNHPELLEEPAGPARTRQLRLPLVSPTPKPRRRRARP